MAIARPLEYSLDWLVEAVKNRLFGSARQMLVLALAKLTPRNLLAGLVIRFLRATWSCRQRRLRDVAVLAELTHLEISGRQRSGSEVD